MAEYFIACWNRTLSEADAKEAQRRIAELEPDIELVADLNIPGSETRMWLQRPNDGNICNNQEAAGIVESMLASSGEGRALPKLIFDEAVTQWAASNIASVLTPKYYVFDEAMCGPDFDGSMDSVSFYLTERGYPSMPYHDSYNGAPSEAKQAEAGARIPPDRLFFEAVAHACNLAHSHDAKKPKAKEQFTTLMPKNGSGAVSIDEGVSAFIQEYKRSQNVVPSSARAFSDNIDKFAFDPEARVWRMKPKATGE